MTQRNRMRLGVMTVIAAATLTACGQTAEQTANNVPGAPPSLGHVHGLGIDPADGTLYAASHYGVFRLPDQGEPELIADRQQDTMGFTVVGPRHFLGSGHPAPDEDLPPHLGLIESTDAGQTWAPLSLSGQADFHALEAKHNQVYGYDSQSQQLMVTSDRQNWDRRASIALADFTVHPTNANTVLATTEEGPARSTDGGRTFATMPKAPLLLLLDWPSENTLIGIDPDGRVHTSKDGGTSWSTAGQVPGAPQALATNGSSEVYVATETGIYASRDGGRTFTLRQELG
ncbi:MULTISPECIES: F510_1955 family glycosylhydrolase [Prauserella]|nr:exo-alpha-sialidase [Prauserella endophytica]TKG58258.1 exo-alpha-sialidase [Prauserella endophytica]